MIYLDNAATSFPKPKAVAEAVYKSTLCFANSGRGSYRLSSDAGKIIFGCRNKISEMFGCEVENVIFTKNCTESLNIAIKGLLEKGDHVIISSLEHNSVSRPLEKLRQNGLISYSVACVDPKDDEKTLQNFKNLIRPETKLIVCTHVSNVFGTVLPIEKISKLAQKSGILFVVDAAQSAGTQKYDLRKIHIDVLCMPGHKGLFGPVGTGIMILGGSVTPRSLIEGGTGSLSLEKSQPEILPDKFESGTLNLPGVAGISAGIDFIRHCGGESAIYEHEKELTEIFINDAKNIPSLHLFDNMHSDKSSTLISFRFENVHSEKISEELSQLKIATRGGYHCSHLAHTTYKTEDTGTVRISPGIFTTKKDIKYLTFCLEKIAKNLNLC